MAQVRTGDLRDLLQSMNASDLLYSCSQCLSQPSECRRAVLLVCKLDGSNVCAPCPFTANPLRVLKIDHVLKSVAEQVYYSPAPSCQLLRTSLTAILRNWQDGWTCIVIASTGDCGEVQMCRCQKNAGPEDSCSSFFQQNC